HGIFLHNRGMGFSLEPGHPAEYLPGRRPPHTLSPLLITESLTGLDTVLGTMGGDAQPQVLLQLIVRLLALGQAPGQAIAAPRRAGSSEGPARPAHPPGSPPPRRSCASTTTHRRRGRVDCASAATRSPRARRETSPSATPRSSASPMTACCAVPRTRVPSKE